jgi:hypothetical protein
MPDGKVLVDEAGATDRSGGSCSAAGPVVRPFGHRPKNRRIPRGKGRASQSVSFCQIVIRLLALVGFERGRSEDPCSRIPALRTNAPEWMDGWILFRPEALSLKGNAPDLERAKFSTGLYHVISAQPRSCWWTSPSFYWRCPPSRAVFCNLSFTKTQGQY